MRTLVLFALISLSGAAAATEATIKTSSSKRLPGVAVRDAPGAGAQLRYPTDLGRLEAKAPQRHTRRVLQEATGRFGGALIAGKSAILVFPPGASQPSAELASADDKAFVQEVEPGKFGFSRAINATGRKRILEYYEQYGGNWPPPLDHQGINDAFAEKASVIHYFYNGEWLELQGADRERHHVGESAA